MNSLRDSFKIEIDFWDEPRMQKNWLNMMVKTSLRKIFEDALRHAKLKFELTIEDMGHMIEKQLKPKLTQAGDHTFNYTKYHTLDEINQWMLDLQKEYPQLVTILNITRSYEGRDIYAIKISVPNQRPNKKAVWYDGGIHAREW